MKFNVAQSVVDLVEAPDAESALKDLNRRLAEAGFEIFGEATEPGAFESEDQEGK